jgi:hypothetical protein
VSLETQEGMQFDQQQILEMYFGTARR